MTDPITEKLKEEYDLDELPPTTTDWNRRLSKTLGQTIDEQVYCPYCDTTAASSTAETDDTHSHVLCSKCNETIQYKHWESNTPEPLDTLVFHCPNNCHGHSVALGVEIHKHEYCYIAECTNCNDICHEGTTTGKHRYEQLTHILEAELNNEFRDAENISMTTTTAVTR